MEALLPVLLDHLPPEAVAGLAGFTLLMTIVVMLGKLLDAVIPWLRLKSLETETDADDRAVDALVLISNVLAFVNRWIPHTVIGSPKPESTMTISTERSSRAGRRDGFVDRSLLVHLSASTVCLAVCLALIAILSGCSPSSFARAHTALDITSTAVRGIEDVVTVAYVNPLHARCLERLEDGASEEEWKRCTRGARLAGEIFAESRVAIFTAETGVISAEQVQDESRLCRSVTPLAAVLPNVVAALGRAGIPIPDELETYLPLVSQGVMMLCGATP